MSENHVPLRAISLPAILLAKMEELKQDKEEDRNKSVEEIVQRFCQEYVDVREMARWELAHMDELNRSYEERPYDFDDADVWEEVNKQTQEEPK